MNNDSIQELWHAYEQAWSDVPAAERERLLERSVTQDCYFANPVTEGSGRSALASTIKAFQMQSPGAYLTTHTLITHHQQLLAAWTIYSQEGVAMLSGHNTARYTDEGQMTHIAGFWTV